MNIEYSKHAAKYLMALDKPTRKRIGNAIEGLTETPPQGDIKLLQGYVAKTFRLRVGKFRIIYRYDVDTNECEILYVSDIDSRGDIYK